MGKFDNMDFILKEALKPDYEPTDELNQKILRHIKEDKMMQKRKRKYVKKMSPVAAAAAILSICLLGGITTYAAIKYLTPSEAASEVFENGYLAEAFEEANAIQMNEQMTGDGYLFTLLGITSGKGLNGYLDANEEKLLDMGMPSNDIIRRCHIVSGTEQTVSADETGGYKYYLEEDMLSSYIDAAFIDKSGDWQITGYGCDDTLDSLEISMYRYNADGTITFALFTPNEE